MEILLIIGAVVLGVALIYLILSVIGMLFIKKFMKYAQGFLDEVEK